ncbi:hypothetical protein ACIO3O_27550 [Streptomyces sp. NPDC087440]|uniref:hypothetical protein n=1 Tax=Streptomyces sp. NPDC087440 TaxID=3365790 RepID=UPI00380D6E0A
MSPTLPRRPDPPAPGRTGRTDGRRPCGPAGRRAAGAGRDFPSYSAAEPTLIGQSVLASQGDVPDNEANAELAAVFTRALVDGLADARGNGRLARELCQKSAALRDLRLYSALTTGKPTRAEMVAVHAEDVVAAYEELTAPHRVG